MTNPEQKIVEEFEKSLTEWTETDDHLYDCIGYSEGCHCCLDGAKSGIYGINGRPKITEILKKGLKFYKTLLLQSLLERGPTPFNTDKVGKFERGYDVATVQWRNLINLMINE